MRTNPILNQVEEFVNGLPSDLNYILKYIYVLKNPTKKEVNKIYSKHRKMKQTNSIIGALEENVEEMKEITIFEIMEPGDFKTLQIKKIPDAIITINHLGRYSLINSLQPIIEGTEEKPFQFL
jgi:hypothetical protein